MSWLKLDDKFHMHEKARLVFRKNPAAIALWTMCLSYCGDQLTDGFVPAWYVATLMPGRKGIQSADLLVAEKLWERAELSGEKGWVFHDYLVYNKPREEVLADREFERLRKAEQRKRAKEQARAEAMSQWDSQRDSQGESQWVSGLPDPTRPEVVVLFLLLAAFLSRVRLTRARGRPNRSKRRFA